MGLLESLFGPKRPIIRAEDLCEQYLDDILSAEKRSSHVDALTKLKLEYKELQGIDAQKYIEEITALSIEMLRLAWDEACLMGVLPEKHVDDMVSATLGISDTRVEKYEPLIEAYSQAIGRSPDLETIDAIKELTSTLLERICAKGVPEELTDRLHSELGAFYYAMEDGLKSWRLE
jgi:hypothetical protein